jgi:hypothetical protein
VTKLVPLLLVLTLVSCDRVHHDGPLAWASGGQAVVGTTTTVGPGQLFTFAAIVLEHGRGSILTEVNLPPGTGLQIAGQYVVDLRPGAKHRNEAPYFPPGGDMTPLLPLAGHSVQDGPISIVLAMRASEQGFHRTSGFFIRYTWREKEYEDYWPVGMEITAQAQ